MMNEIVENKYHNTLKALNELFELVELKDLTKVSEIFTRVNSLKTEVEKSFKLSEHPAIKDLLEREFDGMILHFAESNKSIQMMNVNFDRNQNLEAWNRNITWIPKILELLTLFNSKGSFDCRVTETQINFKFSQLGDFDMELVRPSSYALTRDLLDQKGMFTFDILEECVEFNLSWEDNQNYLWVFSEEESKVQFALPKIISTYQISKENLAKKGKHLTYVFDRNFTLRDTDNLEEILKKDDHTILHFSFLFRPVSLIIPYEGQILPAMRIQGKPGWQPLWSEQDVGQNSFQYIDWFKLIQS